MTKPKTHKPVVPKPILEGFLTKGAIKRLGYRAGIKIFPEYLYEEILNVAKDFLETTMKDAVLYTEHDRQVTVSTKHIDRSLKKNGQIVYC